MPTTLTEGTAWSASVQVPNDGEAANQASILPAFVQPLTDRTKYLVNRVGGSADSLEWAYPTPRSRRVVVNVGLQVFPVGSATITRTAAGHVFTSNSGLFLLDLKKLMPNGAVLSAVKWIVAPGAARTGSDRMGFQLTQVTHDFTTGATVTTTPIAFTYDDGTTATQVITAAASVTISNANTYAITLQSGNTASTNNDAVGSMAFDFSDPGPRNF